VSAYQTAANWSTHSEKITAIPPIDEED
jgi:hypothetical protein